MDHTLHAASQLHTQFERQIAQLCHQRAGIHVLLNILNQNQAALEAQKQELDDAVREYKLFD